MIKTIVFDLNKTLVTYKTKRHLIEDYLKNIGVDRGVFWKTWKKYFQDYNTGKININEFFKKILAELNLDKKLLTNIKKSHEDAFSLIDGIYDILLKLKPDYRLILLAGDGRQSLKFKLDNFNLRCFFSKIYATCYEGVAKENPKIYMNLIQNENVVPNELLFIDDSEKFIKIAHDLGMSTILFKNAEQLKKDMIVFGIDFS